MKNKLLLIIFLITSGVQAQLIETDFQGKVEEASFITEAEVLSENSFYADGSQDIYTIYELLVYKIFKGDNTNISNENRAYVILPGGNIGNEGLIVEPNLSLEVGEVNSILLKENTVAASNLGYPSNLLYEPIQNAQSRYNYNCDTGEVLGFFQTFLSVPIFYEQLAGFSGQSTLEIQAYEPCTPPAPIDPNAIVISGFSPASVPAGAREVLTITGSGFGNSQGGQGVIFYQHSSSYLKKLQQPSEYLSWTDTQIELYVPYWAGTGRIAVGYTSSHVWSANTLTVPYAETNVNYYQTRHVKDAPGAAGGYIFHLNDDFSANSLAVDAFERARENWICETEMNWYVDAATTSINTPTTDNINVVTFDPSMSSGVLGLCYTRFSSCGGERYVTEQDLTFNPSTNWNFTTNSPSSNEVDFESVVLHELGHSRLLSHVIDPNKVMHRSTTAGVEKRIISADEVIGGLSINSRSTNIFNEICGKDAMISILCPPLGIDEFSKNSIILYPNPAKSIINIEHVSNKKINLVVIYSITGIEMLRTNNSISAIDISSLSSGIYFVKISSEGNTVTKKIIKE